jgi:hypothetical protein
MLRPIIMIGCGGSGQKAVRYVRDAVVRHLEHSNWDQGVPKAWQFLGVDTLTTQEDPTIPFLPSNDYKSVSLEFSTYQALNKALEANFAIEVNSAAFSDLQGWRPNPTQVAVPLRAGAGQLRAVGRTAGILALQKMISDRLANAFTECTAGGPQLAEVSRHLGVEVPPGTQLPDPLTLIVGSMAGGTGAGIMLDVVDLVRRTNLAGAFPVLVAFTPDIFGEVKTDLMTANSAAFLSEMLSAYWDDEATDSALIPSKVAVATRGPHSIFLIGRRNIDGLDLKNSNNVYRAVGEALAAVCTSVTVQTNFHNFITVNWGAYAPANAGGMGFQAQRLKGVASSFGSATISIGRDRFRGYLGKLLHRSIVEHLAEGFDVVATSVLGDAAKSMAGPAKIAELARRNSEAFMITCGLHEADDGAKQISDRFVSREIMQARLTEVANKIRAPFVNAAPQSGANLQRTLTAQAAQVKAAEVGLVDSQLRSELRTWGTNVFDKILRATTEYSGTLSLPVVIEMLSMTRAGVLKTSGQFREDAKRAMSSAGESAKRSQGHLAGSQRGALAITAAPVQETIQDLAKAIVLEWSARVREKVAVALESVATTILANVQASLSQALSRVVAITKSVDGKPAVVAGWPRNDGVVPTGFVPSPVEFFLEGHDTWPELSKELISSSLGDRSGLPLVPVEAARLLIIRGNFGGDGSDDGAEPPFVWSRSGSGGPEWEPGQVVQIEVADEMETLSRRIDKWLMRPNMELSNALLDDLGAYLLPVNRRTGAAIPDHQERLSRFRQQLMSALMQSRPLIEIDRTMMAQVHRKGLEYELNIQGFPFGDGHPAREMTEQVIKSFLSSNAPVNWAFSSSEAESVLITSFLKYPVNPSVVLSFTQPLLEALHAFTPEHLRASFWQWRRARILENFIPLPDDLRVAAIRGFAVARILGVVTADPTGQNSISNDKGVFNFPKDLLTETDRTNILPCLLEAMILSFGDAPTRGKEAFDAYGALVNWGMGGGLAAGFEVDGPAAEVLKNGNYGAIKILDTDRARALAAEPPGRVKNAISYVDANLQHFDALEAQGMDPRSWRNVDGSVDPVNTLTRELLTDLRKGYVMVLNALKRFDDALAKGSTTGPV